MLQMAIGSDFQADGRATENARSRGLMKVDGIVYVIVSHKECRLCCRDASASVWTVSLM